MNRDQYEQFMERVHETPAPCRYGHIDCSDRDGGRCCDEEHPRDHEEDA